MRISESFLPTKRWVFMVPLLGSLLGFTALSGHEPAPQTVTPFCEELGCVDRANLDGGCAADISYPIQLIVEPRQSAVPGGVVEADIRLESRMQLDNVKITIEPTPGLALIATPIDAIGNMAGGDVHLDRIAVQLPNDKKRRMVTIHAEGMTDGFVLKRTAVLNLLPGGGEAFRIVETPDGRRVREVRVGGTN